jgi:hypothetical protein
MSCIPIHSQPTLVGFAGLRASEKHRYLEQHIFATEAPSGVQPRQGLHLSHQITIADLFCAEKHIAMPLVSHQNCRASIS